MSRKSKIRAKKAAESENRKQHKELKRLEGLLQSIDDSERRVQKYTRLVKETKKAMEEAEEYKRQIEKALSDIGNENLIKERLKELHMQLANEHFPNWTEEEVLQRSEEYAGVSRSYSSIIPQCIHYSDLEILALGPFDVMNTKWDRIISRSQSVFDQKREIEKIVAQLQKDQERNLEKLQVANEAHLEATERLKKYEKDSDEQRKKELERIHETRKAVKESLSKGQILQSLAGRVLSPGEIEALLRISQEATQLHLIDYYGQSEELLQLGIQLEERFRGKGFRALYHYRDDINLLQAFLKYSGDLSSDLLLEINHMKSIGQDPRTALMENDQDQEEEEDIEAEPRPLEGKKIVYVAGGNDQITQKMIEKLFQAGAEKVSHRDGSRGLKVGESYDLIVLHPRVIGHSAESYYVNNYENKEGLQIIKLPHTSRPHSIVQDIIDQLS